jgi:hypothetical protein
VRPRHRVRLAVNLLNGSTLAGLAVALAGRARLDRAPEGLLAGTGYRLPVPAAPAFTLGNVIISRRDELDHSTTLFRHEARHCTQYAGCGGVAMLPLYFAAAGVSWLLCGDFGAWNVFERGAGLADGGYNTARPLRPQFSLACLSFGSAAPSAPPAAGQAAPGSGPRSAVRAGLTAIPCQSAGTPPAG